MRIIQSYLGKIMIESTLMVLGVITALMIFANLVGEMGDLGQGDYNMLEALIYVLLTLPQHLYELFPMATMLGVLLGLGSLAAHSELIVLRSCAVSIGQTTFMVLKAVILMIVVSGLLGMGVTPQLTHYAEKRKLIDTSGGQALATVRGTWLKSYNNFIHIQSILPGGHFTGITIYTFNDKHQMLSSLYAKKAEYQQDHLALHEISISEFKNNEVLTAKKENLNFKMILNPIFMHAAEIGTQELSLVKLYKFIHYQKANGLHASEYILAFWQRLFNPIATLIMVFLAIPFIFGPLRNSTIGLKIVMGVVLGFTFYILNEFFGPMSIVYQFPPLLGAILPSLLFFILGLVMMKRVG